MNKIKIPNTVLGFKPLVSDYLLRDKKIKPLVNDFFSEDAIANQIERKQTQKVNREIIVNAIKNQYQKSKIEFPIQVDKLLNDNCYTVTTGHQLNIFGGPLYLFYKIIETINLAEHLKQNHPNLDFLPVFWMASEDHDFEEINHTFILGESFVWNTHQSGAVGRFLIDENFISLVSQVTDRLKSKPFGEKFSENITSSYLLGDTLANCNRRFIHSFFKDTPLIIIDGDDFSLKQLCAEIFEKELNDKITLKEVTKTNGYLSKNNYHQQVFVREYNLFHIEDSVRQRIESFDASKKIEPEKISPNAFLRPVYQELILPNLVYIGGAGEIAYWLQLKATFDAMKVIFPLISVRNSSLFIDNSSWKKMQKLGITADDIFKPTDILKNEYLNRNNTESIGFDDELKQLNEIYYQIEQKTKSADETLAPKVKADFVRVEQFLSDLRKRIEKHQKQKFDTSLQQIETIKNKLFPNSIPQERTESMLSMLAIYGDDFLLQTKATILPFDASVKVRIDE
jgi:bacillithiol synthase